MWLTSPRQCRCHAGWSSPLASPPKQTHRHTEDEICQHDPRGFETFNIQFTPEAPSLRLKLWSAMKTAEGNNEKVGFVGKVGQSEELISSGLWTLPLGHQIKWIHAMAFTRDWVHWIGRDTGDILKPSAGASERQRKLKDLTGGCGKHSFLSHDAFWTTSLCLCLQTGDTFLTTKAQICKKYHTFNFKRDKWIIRLG